MYSENTSWSKIHQNTLYTHFSLVAFWFSICVFSVKCCFLFLLLGSSSDRVGFISVSFLLWGLSKPSAGHKVEDIKGLTEHISSISEVDDRGDQNEAASSAGEKPRRWFENAQSRGRIWWESWRPPTLVFVFVCSYGRNSTRSSSSSVCSSLTPPGKCQMTHESRKLELLLSLLRSRGETYGPSQQQAASLLRAN